MTTKKTMSVGMKLKKIVFQQHRFLVQKLWVRSRSVTVITLQFIYILVTVNALFMLYDFIQAGSNGALMLLGGQH